MEEFINDKDYMQIINDIYNNETFNELENIVQHNGSNRLIHSYKVSYYSYKIAKKLRLDYKSVARGGLLHDFFMSDNNNPIHKKLRVTLTHPKYAVINASNLFILNDKEKNIIKSHMFPIFYTVPRYLESWLVSLVDKAVATYEFYSSYKSCLKYAMYYIYFLILFSI